MGWWVCSIPWMRLYSQDDMDVIDRWVAGCVFAPWDTLVGFRFLLGSMLFKERDDVLSLLYLNTFRAIFIVIRLTQTHRRVCNMKNYYCRTIMRLAISYGWSTNPAKRTPRRNMALLRAYEPLVSLDKVLLNPFFWGWYVRGGVGWQAMNICVPAFFFNKSRQSYYPTRII